MKIRTNKMRNMALGAVPVFLAGFLVAFFVSSVFTPVNLSDAANLVSANVSYEGFYVKMSTSDVPMELLTTTTGSMTVVSSTVKAATNSPAGYELYLGISPDDSAGVEKESADKQKNGLYLDGDLSRTDGAVFSAAPGTGGKTGTPSALSNNTWGYAVDKNTTGVPSIWANENHTTMTSATPTDDKFAAVPTYGSEDLIQETTTPNVEIDTAESDVQETDYTTATLYYGIRGDMSKIAGSYSNTIAYTAVAKTPSVTSNITFSPASYTHTGGTPWTDTLTIMTQLYTEASDLGSATVTFSGGPNNVSGLACANPAVSTVDSLLRITCTLPEAAPGTYDVQVFLNKFDQAFTGSYTYEEPKTIATATYMQEVEQCPSTLTEGQQYTLTDQGETSKSYTTARLADGKCWMTSNYNRSAGSLSSTYYNIGSGRSYSVPTSDCSTSSWSSDSGNYYCNNSTYGGYYSYYAATAGINPSSGASSYDICPKGWRLPTLAEYNTLISTYGASSAGSKLVAAPVNMKYGGLCYSYGCPYYAGSYGYYWSANSSSLAYALLLASSSARTNNSIKSNGYSVRCVFGS